MSVVRTKFVCPKDSDPTSEHATFILAADVTACRKILQCRYCTLANSDPHGESVNQCNGPMDMGTWEEVVHG